jgi:fructokinase
LDALISLADVVKVSDEDLNWINQTPMPLEDKARALLDQGPAFVIVTRGGEGASGFLKNGAQIDVPAQPVQIVDTVGAGDTFNAGVVAKLNERGHLTKKALSTLTPEAAHEALSFAASVAAITVSRAGANPPWRDEL